MSSPSIPFANTRTTKPRKTPTWFALNDDRPLGFFAGIWTTRHGKRGTETNPVEGEHQLFGFWTTDASAEVGIAMYAWWSKADFVAKDLNFGS